ncbi:MAG: C25 family cysteine peptidase, partial [Planctomycetota bacterium]
MNRIRQVVVLFIVLLAGPAAGRGGVVARDVTRPDGEADYLVVAPAASVEVLKPLTDLRTRQGRVVKLLPVEKIYRGFGDGTPSAEALNRCLVAWRDAPGRKRPVGFVLLVGLPGSRTFALPTKIVEARFSRGTWGYPVSKYLASDLALVGPSKRNRPVPAVGRLPADTRAELSTMVSKTVDYETNARPGPWRRHVELAAGQGHYGPALDGMLENISKLMMREVVPSHVDVTVSYAKVDSPYGYLPSHFSRRLVEAVSRGPALSVYVGHGRETGFDSLHWQGKSYRLLGIEDVEKLDVPHSRGVMVALAC